MCHATSLTIEPIPATFEYLMRNVRLNNLANIVQAHNIGVGSKRGNLFFTKNMDVCNRVVLENEAAKYQGDMIQVEVVPLDELLKDKSPLVLKIDVEGFEQEVIAGADNTLKTPTLRCVVIELSGHENRYGFSYKKVHTNLIEQGFIPYAYFPFERKLEKLNDFNHNKFNTLYLRDVEWVMERISQAPQVTMLNQNF